MKKFRLLEDFFSAVNTQPHENAKHFKKGRQNAPTREGRVGAKQIIFDWKGPVTSTKWSVGIFDILHRLLKIANFRRNLILNLNKKYIRKIEKNSNGSFWDESLLSRIRLVAKVLKKSVKSWTQNSELLSSLLYCLTAERRESSVTSRLSPP